MARFPRPRLWKVAQLRFVALAVILLAIPVFHALLRAGPRYRHAVWSLFGILPFVTGAWHLDVSIISWAMWPGYVKGMLVSLLDAVAIAVLIATPSSRTKTPFVWIIVAYILVAALSVFHSDVKMASFFYVWLLLRMLLVFVAVSRITERDRGAYYIIRGLAVGIVIQAAFSLYEKLHGAAQASGTMAHQNSLGMATHFALFPCLALLLSGRRDKLIIAGFVSAVICVVFTGSRATIGIAAVGIVILIALSYLMRPNSRKMGIIGMGVVAMVLASPIAYIGLSKRLSSESIESSNNEREAFKRAAWMIVADHPFGIGANEYVVTANTGGYSARAGVAWNGGSRATNVHNTYLLMTAELGYLGAAAYILLMTAPILGMLLFAMSAKEKLTGEIALGIAAAIGAVAVHAMFEWIYVTDPMIYLHAVTLGAGAGLMLRYRSAQRPKKPAVDRNMQRLSLS